MRHKNLEKIEQKVKNDPLYHNKTEVFEILDEIKKFSMYNSQLAKELDNELDKFIDDPQYLYLIFKKPIFKMFLKKAKTMYEDIQIESTKTGISIELEGYYDYLDIKFSKRLNFFYLDKEEIQNNRYVLLYNSKEYLFLSDIKSDIKNKKIILKKVGKNGRDEYAFSKPHLNNPKKFNENIVKDILTFIIDHTRIRHNLAA